ncbi:pro-resilin-like [Trichoplusia ni]|uniref:Pro-resilin-like n=1 Tax=Trichoplusia ni TaxID=7111 RepID=A0A7E5WTW8_TRINI|nr:pro-resilin-like [Trichoplusia ni]
MKILILCALAVVCLAEPPVDNRYLPPSAGSPSAVYGTPGAPGLRQTDAVFRSRQPSRAGSRRPSSQYGAPQPSNRYGPPQSNFGQYNAPSSTYGAPGQSQAPSSQYGAPSTQYGAPSSQYGAPSQFGGSPQFGAPSSQYGAPAANAPSQQYGAPSQQYGAPGFGGGAGGYSQGGQQSRQYLPPGGRGGYGSDDGSNGEPANYNFEYMVKDDQSGNDFGHRESRQGDRAEGQYYVLLPDGRKQTVQYEADQDGYKPKISYEDTGLGQGGYDRNSQDGYNGNGYQGQGPY